MTGGGYAVREIMDLAARSLNSHNEAIRFRAAFDEQYRVYYQKRKQCVTDEIIAVAHTH